MNINIYSPRDFAIYAVIILYIMWIFVYRKIYRPKNIEKMAKKMGLIYQRYDERFENVDINKYNRKEPVVQNICYGYYKSKKIKIYDLCVKIVMSGSQLQTVIELDNKNILDENKNSLLFQQVAPKNIIKIVDEYIDQGTVNKYNHKIKIIKVFYFLIAISFILLIRFII